MSAGDARTRMAHLLCDMAVRHKAAPAAGEIKFRFAVTQVHLADATGLTPVHVNRTLRGLSDEALAFVGGRQVRIPDWHRLAAAGEFDPLYLQTDTLPESGLRIVASA